VLVIPAKAGIQKKLIDFIIELIIETPLKVAPQLSVGMKFIDIQQCQMLTLL